MQRVIKLIKESPAIHVATVDKNGRPRVRPFALMLEQDGKMFFCTSGSTSAYMDLQHSPYIALSAVSPDFKWVKITATAVFTDDRNVKEKGLQKEQLKKLFGSADNPDFNVFYLAEGKALLCDYSGNPNEELEF